MRHQIKSMGAAVWILLTFLAAGASAAGNLSEGMNVDAMAVYSQGVAIVQETRSVMLAPGVNEVELRIPDGLILESLLLQSDAEILWTSFRPSLAGDLLSDAVGQTVEVIDQTGAMYRGELLGEMGGILLRQETGAIIAVSNPITIRLPDAAAFVATEDAKLVVAMSSGTGGEIPVDLLYLVSGVSWEASYTIIVSDGGTAASLRTGIAVTNNAGGAFSTPSLSLIAGDVSIEQAAVYDDYARVSALAFAANAPSAVSTAAVGEYYRYTLPYRVALESAETLALSYVSAEGVALAEEFIYDAAVSDQVRIQYSFENDARNGLDIPLPAGAVRVYQIDDVGPVLLGEDTIPHTPAGDSVQLQVGAAFDLEGSRTILERTWISEDRYQEEVEIVLTNAKDEPVAITVNERPSGYTWTILGATAVYEAIDAGTIRFDVTVPPHGESVVRYTVEYTY
ncbi:hypothetical protein JW848_09955 [Candidatus Bipolaricaulota bacterium]|nr:hypothetical protein [Candidatus Bipolaricaulota bacterium]